MWRNILCHAFIQIIMLLVLIFVIPGWLVHNYEILQMPLTKVNGVCEGYESDDTCTLINPWYASEVYQNNITIDSWKTLKATKDSDYNQT